MGIGAQHDDCIGEGEQLVCVGIVLCIDLVIGQRELPDYAFYLLGLLGQLELGQQQPQCNVELHFVEVKILAEGVQYLQCLFIILAKVVAEHLLIQGLSPEQILGDVVGAVTGDNAPFDVLVDGYLWFLIEIQNELLVLAVLLLQALDIVQLV